MPSTTAARTDPKLWNRIVAKVKRGSKGGDAGEWSARKAQLATAEYKKAGGGYEGKKSRDNHLSQWTREDWGTKSGKRSKETGERYLPKKARESMTDNEYAETTAKKRADTAKGKQHSRQPAAAARKSAAARKGSDGSRAPARRAAAKRDAPARGATGGAANAGTRKAAPPKKDPPARKASGAKRAAPKTDAPSRKPGARKAGATTNGTRQAPAVRKAAGETDPVRRDFREAVNMPASALERHLNTKRSYEVGFKRGGRGESVGHEMGTHIVELLRRKDREEFSAEDKARMKKVVGYIRRHLAQRPKGDVRDTDWAVSLKNWGHDPLKD
jgi:hypothetical protein